MLTPYLSPEGPDGEERISIKQWSRGKSIVPSSGTSCLPPLMLDSIMTPVMERSPAINCSQMESTTFGWLRWFLREFPSRPG